MAHGTKCLARTYDLQPRTFMTDYRLRNQNLLYADTRHKPLGLRNLAIFGAIALTVSVGVVGYLMERFNAAGSGFAAPSLNVQRTVPSPATVQLTTPRTTGSGS